MKKYILLFGKIFLYIILSLIALFVTIISFSYYYYSVGYSSVSLDEKVKVFSGITQSDFIVSDSGSTRRSGNTFLSIPEWYIVSISDDYTTWLEKGNNPSDFPYMQYLKDYWIMYGKITAIMDEQIPRDYEYHTMVRVIGLSTTLEFGLKATYEYTIGRITSLRSWKTPIDTYYTEISRKYVDFILLRPWYEFNYTDAIIGLQYNTGTSLVRSTERYILYFGEFFIKKFYAKLIENAAKSSFAVPDIWTSVRGSFSADVDSLDPKNINITQDGIRVTRYYPFTEILPKILELPQSNIVDIAGNKKIVIETISTTEEVSTGSIFSFTIPIDASKKRNYIYLKPESIKNYMNNSSVKISHIYDF